MKATRDDIFGALTGEGGEQLLASLSYREREIIKLRYGIGDGYTYTLEEVGRIFKVTRERVRCVERKAAMKIEAWLWHRYRAEIITSGEMAAAG